MLIYEQQLSNSDCVFGGLNGYGSVWCACSAQVRIQLQTELFREGLVPDN